MMWPGSPARIFSLFFLIITISSAAEAAQYDRLPLAFEPSASSARVFVARGDGYLMQVSADGLRLRLRRQSRESGWKLVGAKADAAPTCSGLLPGHSNYVLGTDRSHWRLGVPMYANVRFAEVYPGIDLLFYGNQRELEHDYFVQPGVDVAQIRLKFTGTARLEANGDLAIGEGDGRMLLLRPRAYQLTRGGAQQPVAAAYRLQADGTVGFTVGRYDHSRALTIDPVLSYSTYLAGSAGDTGSAIAVDAQGNAYIAGMTWSSDFPKVNPYQSACASCSANPDLFVTKLNATGTALVYSTFIGGSGYDEPASIAVDGNGNAIVGGRTDSGDFPVLAQPSWGGYPGTLGYHGFLLSLNASGSGLNFSTYVGGTGQDAVAGVAVDGSGNVFATGTTYSPNFPVTPGTLPAPTPAYPLNDIFAMKLTPVGRLTYAALIAPTKQSSSPWANNLYASGIAVDSSGNAYLTGWASDGFPTTAGSYQPLFKGDPNSQTYNAWVAKLNATASAIVYGTYLGGSAQDKSHAIALDAAGSAYITGETGSTNFPVTTGAFQTTFNSPSTAFAAKFDASGANLVYSSFLNASSGSSVAVNSAGAATLIGEARQGLPLAQPIQSQPAANGPTAFVTQFNPAGSALTFSSYYGGSTGSTGSGIAIDGAGALYITGTTHDSDLPTTAGAFQTSVAPPPPNTSLNHAFAAKIDLSGSGPAACAVPTSLQFSLVAVGTSQTKSVTVTNCGTSALTISGVSVTGEFHASNNCPATLAVQASCSIPVTFSPTSAGTLTGTLTVTTNAPVTLRVPLTGGATAPSLSLPSTSLLLPDTLVGTSSPAVPMLIENAGTGDLNITNITITAGFAQTNNCGTVWPGAYCSINVTFSPTAAGTRTGSLTITSNDPAGAKTVTLSGVGISSYPIAVINNLNPQAVPVGGGDVQIAVEGTNFFPGSVISVNGVARGTTYSTPYLLETTVKASEMAQMAESPVTVSNPAPGGGVSAPGYLTVFLTVNVSAAGLAYDAGTGKLFAAVPSTALQYANTLLPIDPSTGKVGTAISIGKDPAKLVITPDHQFLYIGLNGDSAIRRFTPATGTAEPAVPLPSSPSALRPYDIVPVPGDAHSFLVTLLIPGGSPGEAGVALYKDATLETFLQNQFPAYVAADTVRFINDPTTAYGQTGSGYNYATYTVGNGGLTASKPAAISPLGPGNLESDGTYLYTTTGLVWDPNAGKKIGQYGNTAWRASVLPEKALQRTFMLDANGLTAYDQATFAAADSIAFPVNTGRQDLVRWGPDGFAFREYDPASPNANRIVMFRSRLATPGSTGTTPSFTLQVASGSNTSATVSAGQSATYNLTASPANGFSGNVSLGCSGATAGIQCVVTPTTVAVDRLPTPFTVTVSSTAPSGGFQTTPFTFPGATGGVAIALFAFSGLLVALAMPRRRFAPALALVLVTFMLLPGCGGGGNGSTSKSPSSGTAKGTYTLTVTGTAGSATRTITLTYVVQ